MSSYYCLRCYAPRSILVPSASLVLDSSIDGILFRDSTDESCNARFNLFRIRVPSRSHLKEQPTRSFPRIFVIGSFHCSDPKYGESELPQRFLDVAAEQRMYLDLKKPRPISIHPEGKTLLTSPLSVATDHPHYQERRSIVNDRGTRVIFRGMSIGTRNLSFMGLFRNFRGRPSPTSFLARQSSTVGIEL